MAALSAALAESGPLEAILAPFALPAPGSALAAQSALIEHCFAHATPRSDYRRAGRSGGRRL